MAVVAVVVVGGQWERTNQLLLHFDIAIVHCRQFSRCINTAVVYKNSLIIAATTTAAMAATTAATTAADRQIDGRVGMTSSGGRQTLTGGQTDGEAAKQTFDRSDGPADGPANVRLAHLDRQPGSQTDSRRTDVGRDGQADKQV